MLDVNINTATCEYLQQHTSTLLSSCLLPMSWELARPGIDFVCLTKRYGKWIITDQSILYMPCQSYFLDFFQIKFLNNAVQASHTNQPLCHCFQHLKIQFFSKLKSKIKVKNSFATCLCYQTMASFNSWNL